MRDGAHEQHVSIWSADVAQTELALGQHNLSKRSSRDNVRHTKIERPLGRGDDAVWWTDIAEHANDALTAREREASGSAGHADGAVFAPAPGHIKQMGT
jgi:hypothetical protein